MASTSSANGDIPRKIHKVASQLRLKEQQRKALYDPVLVSLGPYHHGKPELAKAEGFKVTTCVHWCASGNKINEDLFYDQILARIQEFRDCYAEVSIVEKFNDEELARMMLGDACFVINYMANRTRMEGRNFEDWDRNLGTAAAFRFTTRDILLLENQLPLEVLKLLMRLWDKEAQCAGYENLLLKFLNWLLPNGNEIHSIPGEVEAPPLHLLEAYRRVMVERENINNPIDQRGSIFSRFKWPWIMPREIEERGDRLIQACRSVMDLKAKGIQITPSSSHSFKDIKFKSRTCGGQLELPIQSVSEQTQVTLSNMIAYEVSPGTVVRIDVLSYTSFMKSLIETPADVKELQENGVLSNRLASHEQVVQLFRDIDTFGLTDSQVFEDVKSRVEKHCRSKSKTWMAQLIHTRFKNPWSVVGLLAAILLLCLTFLQTFFTIFPRK